jgi:hypothetical protein
MSAASVSLIHPALKQDTSVHRRSKELQAKLETVVATLVVNKVLLLGGCPAKQVDRLDQGY